MLILRRRLLCAGMSVLALGHARANEPQARSILVVGDSLSAEYGLPRGSGWVAAVAQRLQDKATGYQIHNNSISGDTTSGGLARLPEALARTQPEIVVLELGSNDALRGLPLSMTRSNLARMIELSQQGGAAVLLLGMKIPPNYGPRYASEFTALFKELALEHDARLLPFLFEGFAEKREFFQDDAIHPNAQGQALMADTIWKALEPMLDP